MPMTVQGYGLRAGLPTAATGTSGAAGLGLQARQPAPASSAWPAEGYQGATTAPSPRSAGRVPAPELGPWSPLRPADRSTSVFSQRYPLFTVAASPLPHGPANAALCGLSLNFDHRLHLNSLPTLEAARLPEDVTACLLSGRPLEELVHPVAVRAGATYNLYEYSALMYAGDHSPPQPAAGRLAAVRVAIDPATRQPILPGALHRIVKNCRPVA